MKKESYKIKIQTISNAIKKKPAQALLLMLFIIVGIVEFLTSLHGFSLLRESKEEDKNTWGAVCKTNTAGGYNTATLKHCLNLDGFSDAYVLMFILVWGSIITLLVGLIGLFILVSCKSQRYSTSQWLKTMSLYPIIFLILIRVTFDAAIDAVPISSFIPLLSSIIITSATIKLLDECWKYQTLCKEEKQQKLAYIRRKHALIRHKRVRICK